MPAVQPCVFCNHSRQRFWGICQLLPCKLIVTTTLRNPSAEWSQRTRGTCICYLCHSSHHLLPWTDRTVFLETSCWLFNLLKHDPCGAQVGKPSLAWLDPLGPIFISLSIAWTFPSRYMILHRLDLHKFSPLLGHILANSSSRGLPMFYLFRAAWACPCPSTAWLGPTWTLLSVIRVCLGTALTTYHHWT